MITAAKMGLFSTSSPFDAEVEKATLETNTTEDWATIMEICDRVGYNAGNAREYLKAIIRRLNHADPHVVLQAITLLNACVSNCNKFFHLEIASREFENEFRKLLSKAGLPSKITERLKVSLKRWVESEFSNDPQLSLIPSLYAKLKQEGHDFSTQEHKKMTPKNPNSVESQQEVDDIAKAIELSLQEKNGKKSSLYPSTPQNNSWNKNATNSKKTMAKALYDFEAVEDNELTFFTGEMIQVLDDSDKNWWRGSNQRGEGLFPANFVTLDISAPPETAIKKEESNVKSVKTEPQIPLCDYVIDERKIDKVLHLLHEANPTSDVDDTAEMHALENQAYGMQPLIDSELEKVDRKHAQLTQLSSNLVDALNLYHSLMREPYHTMAKTQYGGLQGNAMPHMGTRQIMGYGNAGSSSTMNESYYYMEPQYGINESQYAANGALYGPEGGQYGMNDAQYGMTDGQYSANEPQYSMPSNGLPPQSNIHPSHHLMNQQMQPRHFIPIDNAQRAANGLPHPSMEHQQPMGLPGYAQSTMHQYTGMPQSHPSIMNEDANIGHPQ